MVTKMVQLGPGMYSQSSGPCDTCQGKGEIIDKKYIIKEKKIIEAEIDKGSPDGC
jgi:DnaJ family protein A protein 2